MDQRLVYVTIDAPNELTDDEAVVYYHALAMLDYDDANPNVGMGLLIIHAINDAIKYEKFNKNQLRIDLIAEKIRLKRQR